MKKKVYLFCLLVITFICCYSGYKIINKNYNYKMNYIVYKDVLKEVDNKDDFNINFDNLSKKNNDFVGWIVVNDTEISYPVVQGNNNSYYLNHSFDNSYNDAGWIFMDFRNNKDFTNNNSVIYGHSMLDKSMFYSLRKVLTKDWYYSSDHLIYFYTDEYVFTWKVFSVYTTFKEGYYLTTDSNDYDDWIKNISKRSLFTFDDVSSDDKVLTLSSCYDSNKTRMVLHAKLINKKSKC